MFYLRRVSQCLERLSDNRSAWVRELAMAGKHLHEYPFMEELLREMQNFFASGCMTRWLSYIT